MLWAILTTAVYKLSMECLALTRCELSQFQSIYSHFTSSRKLQRHTGFKYMVWEIKKNKQLTYYLSDASTNKFENHP